MNELIDQIDALLDLDARKALAPHGIGGLARELLTKSRAALASPTPGGVVKKFDKADQILLERMFKAFEASFVGQPITDDMNRDLRAANNLVCRTLAALEAASSPAPGEAVAWQSRMRARDWIGSPWCPWSEWQTWSQDRPEYLFGMTVQREYRALYASPPTSPPEPLQGDTGIGWAARNLAHVIANPGQPIPEEMDAANAALERIAERAPELPQGVLEALKRLLSLCEAEGNPFDEAGRPTLAAARAAIANAERSPLPLGGWKLVPEEPTPEMVAAFWRQKNTGCQEPGNGGPDRDDYSAYRAMLGASPSPSSGDA